MTNSGVETAAEIDFLVGITLAEQTTTNKERQQGYLSCFAQLEEDGARLISDESRQVLVRSVLIGLANSQNPTDFQVILEKALVLANELDLSSEASHLESLLEALE